MLQEIDPGLFEAPADSEVQLAVIAQNNNGTEMARFSYNSSPLTTESIQGHDGCRFTVTEGTRQLKVGVTFATDAPPDANYELFQVNDAGVLESLELSVTAADPTPRIAFGIDGTAEEEGGAASVGEPRAARKAARPPLRRARGRKKAAAKRTSAKRTSAKRAPAKRAPAKRASAGRAAKKATAKKASPKRRSARAGRRR